MNNLLWESICNISLNLFYRDTVSKVGEVVNQMGSASAAAQGLTKAITTADRIRNSEHKLYFLIDKNANR